MAIVSEAPLEGDNSYEIVGAAGRGGGMMVVIVLHELLPTAHCFDPADTAVTNAMLLGMAIVSSSLVLFVY